MLLNAERVEFAEVEDSALLHVRALIGLRMCEDALFALSTIVRERPDWAEPWVLVAQALSMKCQFPQALMATERALYLDPSHLWAQELRTGLLLQLDEREEALIAAQQLIAMSPERAESYAFLAFAEAFSGNEHRAVHAARRCRKLAPHKSVGHQAFCVVSLAFERWNKAEQHAMAALEIEGGVASLHHDLGVAQFEQGKFDEANESFATAARLDDRFVGAAERMKKKTPSGVAAIPVMLAMAAGIAAIPLGTMPLAFISVVLIGIASLIVAAKRTRRSMTLNPVAMRPALAVVLCCDFAVAAQQFGLF